MAYKNSIEKWVSNGAECGLDLSCLREDKEAALKRMEELGLPISKRCVASLVDFNANPNQYFDQLNTDVFACALLPASPQYTRVRKPNLDRRRMFNYIRGYTTGENSGAYNGIILGECFEVAMSAIAVVSQNGERMMVESTIGRLSKVKGGKAKFRDENDLRYTLPEDWHWSVGNEDLRSALTRGIQYIPHRVGRLFYGDVETVDQNGMYTKVPGERLVYRGGMHYHPGYYEILVTKHPRNDGSGQFDLEPIFNDHKDEDAYALIPSLEYNSR